MHLYPAKRLPGLLLAGEGLPFILSKEQGTPALAGLWLPGCFPELFFCDLTHLYNGQALTNGGLHTV